MTKNTNSHKNQPFRFVPLIETAGESPSILKHMSLILGYLLATQTITLLSIVEAFTHGGAQPHARRVVGEAIHEAGNQGLATVHLSADDLRRLWPLQEVVDESDLMDFSTDK